LFGCWVLEDYNPSEEINLLYEGIDRYLRIRPGDTAN